MWPATNYLLLLLLLHLLVHLLLLLLPSLLLLVASELTPHSLSALPFLPYLSIISKIDY